MYTKDDIVNMINFLVDNILIEFGGRIFQQTVGIPLGTNCVPPLADLFLHWYEAEYDINGTWQLNFKTNVTILTFLS